jgi:hypothetical protein
MSLLPTQPNLPTYERALNGNCATQLYNGTSYTNFETSERGLPYIQGRVAKAAGAGGGPPQSSRVPGLEWECWSWCEATDGWRLVLLRCCEAREGLPNMQGNRRLQLRHQLATFLLIGNPWVRDSCLGSGCHGEPKRSSRTVPEASVYPTYLTQRRTAAGAPIWTHLTSAFGASRCVPTAASSLQPTVCCGCKVRDPLLPLLVIRSRTPWPNELLPPGDIVATCRSGGQPERTRRNADNSVARTKTVGNKPRTQLTPIFM